ncbi:hypothetical protein XANCAGTX0491_005631 [Xanthoria calcicola]
MTAAAPCSQVTIPDFFVSFLAQEPQINPNHETVKAEADAWMAQQCQYDEKRYQKLIKADFCYLVSGWARDAGPEELRTICDWMNWVFDFDDMFDEGGFRKDREQALTRVEALKKVMRTDCPSETSNKGDPLLEVFKTVWHRVAERASKGAKRRFIQGMVDYTEGIVGQVDVVHSNEHLDEQRLLALRRKTIGAVPCYALTEYYHGLDLPDAILQHPSIQWLDRISTEMMVIHNDALSYLKESAQGHKQNLVAFYRGRGMTSQEAYDQIDVLLHLRYRDWYLAQADLPQWGESMDRQVQKYIRGMEDLITSNLNWSFHTARYLGEQSEEVRRTRILRIPSDQLANKGSTLSLQQQDSSSLSSKANELAVGDIETELIDMKLPAHGDVVLQSNN